MAQVGNAIGASHLAPQGLQPGLQPPPWQTGFQPSHGFTHLAPPPPQQPAQTAHEAAVQAVMRTTQDGTQLSES